MSLSRFRSQADALRTRRALSTYRRRFQQQEQLLRETEQKLTDQGRYLASVAHDMRSPLQTVNVALALISADATPSMEKPLRLARASVARASGLLYDLLDFSAFSHGASVTLKRQKQSLEALVTRALEDARLRFPGRSFQQTSANQDAWVDVDAGRIAQVLDNLISNALLHGAAHTSVSLHIDCREHEVALHVHNAGAISEGARAALFQPLSHGPGAMRRGSMGLGLYIVKQLVEAHQGRIEFTSDSESTTFSVVLARVDEG